MSSSALPSYEEFAAAAKSANLLAIHRTLYFDRETAITLADRFVDDEHFFLLESATAGPGGIARFSFLGNDPLWCFHGSDGDWIEQLGGNTSKVEVREPFAALESAFAKFKLEVVGKEKIDGLDLCRMGGAVGYASYDAGSLIEPSVGLPPPRSLDMPQLYFMVPRNFMILDQLSRKLTVVRYCHIPSGTDEAALRLLYAREVKALGETLNLIQSPRLPPELKLSEGPIDYDACDATMPRGQFMKVVDRCLEEVRKGEVFQIQVGNRLSCKTSARPFDVFRHLRILNPSPYMVFYKFGEHHIICASPEMMVNIVGDRVLHRPIAGTRKKTWNEETDARMRQELASDEKERAEHVMLVDLSRNDIGRMAKAGSVEVDELMIVEEYSHVFHLVSQVSGLLEAGCSMFDAMRLSFPNGTVSGAPKIRAMQLIAELEPCAREFYAGSLGVFNFANELRSTLLIRTLHMAQGVASTQASAGIVYDSIPEQEWLETRNKMAACLTAMQKTL